MIKNKKLFKNLICFFCVGFLTLIFVGIRFFQLMNLTNLETGVCSLNSFFDSCYTLLHVFFVAFSFLFFKYIYRPKFENFNLIKKNNVLGVLSCFISILVFINSFFIFSKTTPKSPISPPFNLMFFLTGVFLAVSFIIFSIYIVFNVDFLKFSLSLIFCSVFLWALVRLYSFVSTNSFLHYATIEYKLNVLGLVFIFLFFYYFGRIVFNYRGSAASCGFLTFGFAAVFSVFANVVPKLFLNFKVWFNAIKIEGSFFERNINLLYFYNFNLVDFVLALFIFSFLIVSIFSNKISENIKNWKQTNLVLFKNQIFKQN